MPSTSQTTPASLSHFVIFSPTLKPAKPTKPADDEERDKDLEDDLREAAQILFYTSREAGGVNRDRMLRQVGLVKGLMGFADMVSVGDFDENDNSKFWSIRSQKSRMIVYSPEPDIFIYVNVLLEHILPIASASETNKGKAQSTHTSQGLPDKMLLEGLQRGYEDFKFQHGSLTNLLPPSHTLSSLLDKFWTRFAFVYESTYLVPSLTTWLGGYPPPPIDLADTASRAIEVFRDDADIEDQGIGIYSSQGPISLDGIILNEAMDRFFTNLVQATIPIPDEVDNKLSGEINGTRKSSWATFGLGGAMTSAVGWVPGLGSRPSTSAGVSADRIGSPKENDVRGIPNLGKGKPPPPPEGKLGHRWPSLGVSLGGIGDAMGSMGTVFGLGTPSPKALVSAQVPTGEARSTESPVVNAAEPIDHSPQDESPVVNENSTAAPSPLPDDSEIVFGDISQAEEELEAPHKLSETEERNSISSRRTSHEVMQTSVILPDLQAATADENELELKWENGKVWIEENNELVERSVIWTIREQYLLLVLGEISTIPSSKAALAVFSKLARSQTSEPSKEVLHDIAYKSREGSVEITGSMQEVGAGLADLKNVLSLDSTIRAVFVKTQSAKLLVAKKGPSEQSKTTSELYMSIGKKDASLTDADYAIRGFLRSHPDLQG